MNPACPNCGVPMERVRRGLLSGLRCGLKPCGDNWFGNMVKQGRVIAYSNRRYTNPFPK